MRKDFLKIFAIILILILLIILGINVMAGSNPGKQRIAGVDDEISLGIHYLDKLDYEAAVVHLSNALKIDNKNVIAYLGMAIAYDALNQPELLVQILQDGINYSGSELLEYILAEVNQGKPISEQYSLQEFKEELTLPQDPFSTLKILGSDYYKWDMVACAELFHFNYDQYKGKNVKLGTYHGLNVTFDATTENVGFRLANDECSYDYRMLSNNEMQFFCITQKFEGAGLKELSEISCQVDMNAIVEEFKNAYGLSPLGMEDRVFYMTESNIGKLTCIQWSNGNETNINIYLSGMNHLCLQLTYEKEKLVKIQYGCSIPDNLRSKAINWIGEVL